MTNTLRTITIALLLVVACACPSTGTAQAAGVGSKVRTGKRLSPREARRARRQKLSRELAAKGEAELRRSVRVFQQKYLVKQGRLELLGGGSMALADAFVQNYSVDAGLLVHISDRIAVGVSGSKIFATANENFESVQSDFGLFPERAFMQGAGFVEAQYSPVFGKFASFGLAVLQMDAYGLAAAGAVRTTTNASYKPALQIGGGFRIHTLRALTIAIEVRDTLFFEEFLPLTTGGDPQTSLVQQLTLGIKLGFWIPPSYTYKYQR